MPKNITEYSLLRDDLWFYETTETDMYESTENFTHLHSTKATLKDKGQTTLGLTIMQNKYKILLTKYKF